MAFHPDSVTAGTAAREHNSLTETNSPFSFYLLSLRARLPSFHFPQCLSAFVTGKRISRQSIFPYNSSLFVSIHEYVCFIHKTKCVCLSGVRICTLPSVYVNTHSRSLTCHGRCLEGPLNPSARKKKRHPCLHRGNKRHPKDIPSHSVTYASLDFWTKLRYSNIFSL